jgi:hypothetical protein
MAGSKAISTWSGPISTGMTPSGTSPVKAASEGNTFALLKSVTG